MNKMFNGCSSLIKVDISNFNINKVISITSMFDGCKSLKEINISHFKGNNITNNYLMFLGCQDELRTKIKAQIYKK